MIELLFLGGLCIAGAICLYKGAWHSGYAAGLRYASARLDEIRQQIEVERNQ